MSEHSAGPHATVPQDSEAPESVHRLEDLLAQLEGRGDRRNGHEEVLERAADARSYYGDNDLAIDVLQGVVYLSECVGFE